MYAKVKDFEVILFPYTSQDLQTENPFTSFDNRFDVPAWYAQTQDAADLGATIVEVQQAPFPTINSATQNIRIAQQPILIEGTWTLPWIISDKTDFELAVVLSPESAG